MSKNGLSSRIQQFLDPMERRRAGMQSPFQRLAQHMEDLWGDGGILKQVIQAGEGAPVPRDASVSIHFSGYLEYADQPFETTRHLKYPRMLKLGRDVTLCGLELGLLTMRKGECSRFLFLPKYAYGDMGCPPLIPPAATVLYEVQVLDFLDSGEVDNFFALTPEEQNTVPLSTLLNVVNTMRCFGNRCFNQSRYEDAKDRYKQAATILKNRQLVDEEERKSIAGVQLPIFLNMSLTLLRLEKPGKALQYGKKALQIDPDNTKALFRCGQAYLELDDYEKALDFLLMAQAKKPFNSDINNLLKKLEVANKNFMERQREMCSKMFPSFSDSSKK
ncbi:inactive peptidyl-prolyl cis-trans isomerase FKBP6 [Megalops cyprinoides]|uniref:inactive peptidyl-prolyl cis-trans isomerase FKBP6 n=1 Tax=Megalops cyprinoides TaxID=118141 RepID=UPI001864C6C4|nr:inactive peptidyl-prolyl cis-trans isomerase FKBP6 [Megalops cyprinoides]